MLLLALHRTSSPLLHWLVTSTLMMLGLTVSGSSVPQAALYDRAPHVEENVRVLKSATLPQLLPGHTDNATSTTQHHTSTNLLSGMEQGPTGPLGVGSHESEFVRANNASMNHHPD